MGNIIELPVMREKKGQTIGLVRGIRDHLMIEGDTIATLGAGIKKLTVQDKHDLASAMVKEFGYAAVTFDNPTPPIAA